MVYGIISVDNRTIMIRKHLQLYSYISGFFQIKRRRHGEGLDGPVVPPGDYACNDYCRAHDW